MVSGPDTNWGIQHATPRYVPSLQTGGVKMSTSDKGAAPRNSCAERWIPTPKEEEMYLSEYETYENLLKQIRRFVDAAYNKYCPCSLGDLSTP